MSTFSLQGISSFLDTLPSAWKAIAALIALIGLAVSISGGVRAGLEVPAKLDRHMQQQDTVIQELRGLKSIEKQKLCIDIANLRRQPWVDCLLPGKGE